MDRWRTPLHLFYDPAKVLRVPIEIGKDAASNTRQEVQRFSATAGVTVGEKRRNAA
jgi:hypothetical protein